MANFGLIYLDMIVYIFTKDMNYHCAKFYTNISTNMDTTNISPFFAIFSTIFFTILPKLANFGSIQLGIIANIIS